MTMTYQEIARNCTSGELFSLVWRCWGWGIMLLMAPIMIFAVLVSLTTVPSAWSQGLLVLAIMPIVAFAQGMLAAAIVIAGRAVLRRRINHH